MLRLFGTLARVMFGFALASIAAGLVTVLFVNSPMDVLAEPFERLPKTVSETFDLALLAATHLAIFASVFVLIAAVLGEWFSIRAPSFYLLAGVAIALLGFTAQYMSEVAGQPTILNNYAIKAFLTIGFFGGLFYWLAAGQFAGHRPEERTAQMQSALVEPTTAPREPADENAEVVITKSPAFEERPRFRMPLLERLSFPKRRVSEQVSGEPSPNATSEDENLRNKRETIGPAPTR